jgi:hypothetical protein
MFPPELLEMIAWSNYESRGLAMTFRIERLLNYEMLDKFVKLEHGEYILPDEKKHTPSGVEPKMIWGKRTWWRWGKVHRGGDKPAMISREGRRYWYKNGNLHRDGDVCAIIYENGSKLWYKNGLLHRDYGPAAIYNDGRELYYKNGRLDIQQWAETIVEKYKPRIFFSCNPKMIYCTIECFPSNCWK